MKIDWRLILALSMFGLVMALATIATIPSQTEPVFWVAIFLFCAVVIGRRARGRAFIHGLLVGIVNSFWVTTAHIAFFHQYLANHPREAAMMTSMPMPERPRVMMLLVGPVVGIASGLVIGLLSLAAGRLVNQSMARAKA